MERGNKCFCAGIESKRFAEFPAVIAHLKVAIRCLTIFLAVSLTRAKCVITALVFLAALCTRSEEILDGAISYTPPIPMFGGDQPGNAGLPISGWSVYTGGGKTNYAQVSVQIMSIVAIFPNPTAPPAEIRSVADLKKYLEVRLKDSTNAPNASTSFTKLCGRDAVTFTTEPTAGAGQWSQSTYAFWSTNTQWLQSSLLHVVVAAGRKDTFDRLVKSLETMKINPAPPVRLAQNKVLLGMSSGEVRERCGEPVDDALPNERYITQKFVINVTYGRDDKVESIAYAKVRDPEQAGRANREELGKELLPMSRAEAEKLLQDHSENARLSWTSVGENRWKRSDGAMAGLGSNSNALVIATAAMWPKIQLK